MNCEIYISLDAYETDFYTTCKKDGRIKRILAIIFPIYKSYRRYIPLKK